MKKIGLLILFCWFYNMLFAQQSIPKTIDSLQNLIKKGIEDSNKVMRLSELSYFYRGFKPDSSMLLAEQNLELSKKLNYIKGFALSFLDVAGAFLFLDNYNQAIYYCKQALTYSDQIPEKYVKGMILNMLGRVYLTQSDYKKALQYFLEALKVREKCGDQLGVAQTYNYIATVYDQQDNKVLALEYHEKALKIREKYNDHQGIAQSLNNIGKMYRFKKEYEKALEYFQNAYKMDNILKYHYGRAIDLNNIASIYVQQNKKQEALKIYEQVLALRDSLKDGKGTVYTLIALAQLQLSLNSVEIAKKHAEQAEKLSEIYNLPNELQDIYFILSKCYDYENNIAQAFLFHKMGTQLKDSLFNMEKSKISANLQSAYDLEKKEAQIDLLYKDKTIQDQSNSFKLNIALLIFLAMSIIAFLLWKNYRKSVIINEQLVLQKNQITEKNEELFQANEELTINLDIINKQRQEILQKNNNITDSINYAKRIQMAILPLEEDFENVFGKDNFFIIYEPKNIVSGDFYWLHLEGNTTMLAVVDCTGHGVPGALMSMIGRESLDKIVSDQKDLMPNQILTLLDIHVRQILKQNSTKTNDGMDICLVQIDKKENQIAYSGAKIPLIYVQDHQLFKIKGNSFSIGGKKIGKEESFTTHIIELDKMVQEVVFYMSSDGYQDQFGGKEGRKFMSKAFKELLDNIHIDNMKEQKYILEKTFVEWKNKSDQTDDITVVGIKINSF
ncbi:MAG: hypothetical protein EAZ97_07040 [Bacteroidetes bacterium]|nr:MAG: hypothetical protein EAZ97_07040 [Bacteroidota bacterium]